MLETTHFTIWKVYVPCQQIKMAERGVDLKSEDEVKDYLERLGIEYRFGCYYEKNPKGNWIFKFLTYKIRHKSIL